MAKVDCCAQCAMLLLPHLSTVCAATAIAITIAQSAIAANCQTLAHPTGKIAGHAPTAKST